MRSTAIAVIALGLSACKTDVPPSANLEDGGDPPVTVTLSRGDTALVAGIPLTFTVVLEDSRCPVDVVCVWAGNAAVELAVGPPVGTSGPTHQLILNTTVGTRVGEAWGLRVTLLELRPEPVSTRQIPPDEYVVKLRVEER